MPKKEGQKINFMASILFYLLKFLRLPYAPLRLSYACLRLSYAYLRLTNAALRLPSVSLL